MLLLEIISGILLLYLGLSAIYLLFYSLVGHLPLPLPIRSSSNSSAKRRIALFLPAYKEDAVILHSALHALRIDYPKEQWDLVVIADSMQAETLEKLRAMPLRLVEVHFEKSTKAKALNRAMEVIGDAYDIAFILDADNLTETDILHHLDSAFERGAQVVQCHRMAKNTDTAFAVLDAISEEINNHIFSLGHRKAGLSSRLVGSGMAFAYAPFKQVMRDVDAIGGFDKELELKLLSKGYRFHYLPEVPILDEKVSSAKVFGRQRSRWIAAQFHYFKRFIGPAFRALLSKGNLDYFDKAIQMVLPPRLLMPGILAIGTLLSMLLLSPTWQQLWGLAFACNVVAFVLAIPKKFYQGQYLRAYLTLPRAFGVMLLAMLKIKGANKTFIHTPHTHSSNQANS